MAQSTYGRAPDHASDPTGRTADQFGEAAGQADTAASRAAEQSRQITGRIQEAAGSFRGALNKSVKDQPMATLAGAAIVGFVLGALWKS